MVLSILTLIGIMRVVANILLMSADISNPALNVETHVDHGMTDVLLIIIYGLTCSLPLWQVSMIGKNTDQLIEAICCNCKIPFTDKTCLLLTLERIGPNFRMFKSLLVTRKRIGGAILFVAGTTCSTALAALARRY